MSDDVGDRRTGQRHTNTEAFGGGADESVDVGEGESGVVERAVHTLPVEIGLRACREITLFGDVHAGDRGIAQGRHGAEGTPFHAGGTVSPR